MSSAGIPGPSVQVKTQWIRNNKHLFNFILEPVGRVPPKFTTGDKSRAFDANGGDSVTLLCPAQAYPAPAFRYINRHEFNISLCNLFLEPLGSAAPKVAMKMIDITEASLSNTVTLLCPAQAFPVPIFR